MTVLKSLKLRYSIPYHHRAAYVSSGETHHSYRILPGHHYAFPMKLSTFALSAVGLMVRYITQIAADQASDARSDALDLFIIAEAFPSIQRIEGLCQR
jgi:hypothetical protein